MACAVASYSEDLPAAAASRRRVPRLRNTPLDDENQLQHHHRAVGLVKSRIRALVGFWESVTTTTADSTQVVSKNGFYYNENVRNAQNTQHQSRSIVAAEDAKVSPRELFKPYCAATPDINAPPPPYEKTECDVLPPDYTATDVFATAQYLLGSSGELPANEGGRNGSNRETGSSGLPGIFGPTGDVKVDLTAAAEHIRTRGKKAAKKAAKQAQQSKWFEDSEEKKDDAPAEENAGGGDGDKGGDAGGGGADPPGDGGDENPDDDWFTTGATGKNKKKSKKKQQEEEEAAAKKAEEEAEAEAAAKAAEEAAEAEKKKAAEPDPIDVCGDYNFRSDVESTLTGTNTGLGNLRDRGQEEEGQKGQGRACSCCSHGHDRPRCDCR